MTEAQEIGKQLREARKAHGVSLAEFAQKIGYCYSYLSNIETGVTPPTAKIANAYQEAFGMKLNLDDVERVRSQHRWPVQYRAQDRAITRTTSATTDAVKFIRAVDGVFQECSGTWAFTDSDPQSVVNVISCVSAVIRRSNTFCVQVAKAMQVDLDPIEAIDAPVFGESPAQELTSIIQSVNKQLNLTMARIRAMKGDFALQIQTSAALITIHGAFSIALLRLQALRDVVIARSKEHAAQKP